MALCPDEAVRQARDGKLGILKVVALDLVFEKLLLLVFARDIATHEYEVSFDLYLEVMRILRYSLLF